MRVGLYRFFSKFILIITLFAFNMSVAQAEYYLVYEPSTPSCCGCAEYRPYVKHHVKHTVKHKVKKHKVKTVKHHKRYYPCKQCVYVMPYAVYQYVPESLVEYRAVQYYEERYDSCASSSRC